MKWWLETTSWTDNTPNGVYLMDDGKSKIYAFKSHGGQGEIKIFKNPIRIDIRGRKFVVNPTQYRAKINHDEPEGRTWIVKGSKGDEYRVSEVRGEYSCTCSGFRFRGKCKHVDSVTVKVN